ncbi:Phosphatidate cytidylyltransferase [Magnetococcus marinus MC-1]|uniref:Phosphatidate cytidylyltransferase n=2 Tax=Magnetococcus TaxID=162171 RepID=A0L8R0_MAGMM|nr:Phosphatidate cytidylyltransferase [Magnetococcus marinus MC-1]
MLLLLATLTPLMFREWQRMVGQAGYGALLYLTLGGWSLLALAAKGWLAWSGALLFVWSALYLVQHTLRYRGESHGLQAVTQVGQSVLGLLYVVIPLQLLLVVHSTEAGSAWILLLLLVMWSTDSAAYFTGRWLGKHKFSPHVSPKKTWEGFWGGTVAGAAASVAVSYGAGLPMPLIHAIGAGVILSVAGQLGDLVESLLKREAGIKDSGNIIPGHGGLLDRLDSMIFTAPAYYLYLSALGVT